MERCDPSLWNVEAMLNAQVDIVNRTNNPLEKYNRDLGEKFGGTHPSLLSFVEVVKRDALRFVETIESIKQGHQTAPDHAGVVSISAPDDYEAFA
jgi:hypothetical protein